MKRALVLTNHLHAWAGSEILALEVSETLKKTYDVSLVANVIAKEIHTECEKQEMTVSSDPSKFNLCDFDFIWAQHLVAPLCNGFVDLSAFDGSFNSVHLSPYEPFELASLMYSKPLGANIVGNSQETLRKINSFYSKPLKTYNLNNATTENFIEEEMFPVGSHKSIKSILIVSNHIPEELASAAQLLMRQGIKITAFGMGQKNYKRLTKADIQAFDAIVTIGKTVQNSILARRPVYCYDRFGGPGYITQDNFELALSFNFSGRCCNRKLDAEQLSKEIILGYEMSCSHVNQLFELGSKLFSLERFLENLSRENTELKTKSLDILPFVENARLIRRRYISSIRNN